jgi:mannose-6-phosphate isomerase-like protein (cupin superfamily)
MPTDVPPQLTDVTASVAFRISDGDTVKLVPLRDPDDLYDASIFLEIWDPGGSQPPNSHPSSVETFLFLSGEGTAYCDTTVTPIRAGQMLVLPPGSTHRICNSSEHRLYAITTMYPDDGFTAIVRGGVREPLDPADLAVLGFDHKQRNH